MKCLDPYVNGGLAFPCGKCSPCLFARRGVWSHRIWLEASCHDQNSFVTLTYRDDSLPADGKLVPRDLELWLKRLRERVAPRRFRFFACGEYGDRFKRPHYHAVLFGYGGCYGRFVGPRKGVVGECSCESCVDLRASWDLGFVTNSPLNEKRAAYIAGYVLKKMDDHDCFQRMSKGLGKEAPVLVGAVAKYKKYLEEFPDVLPYLKYGQIRRPLGRFLTELIRKKVMGEGYLSPRAREYRAQKRLERLRESLRPMFAAAGVLAVAEGCSVRAVVKRAIHQENLQQAVNQAARSRRNETL